MKLNTRHPSRITHHASRIPVRFIGPLAPPRSRLLAIGYWLFHAELRFRHCALLFSVAMTAVSFLSNDHGLPCQFGWVMATFAFALFALTERRLELERRRPRFDTSRTRN